VASFVARRITSPLRDLAAAAADVATGDFAARVEVSSDDEVGVVAASFNKMASELGDADRLQREFFLSISHELRTPLTAIQGYAEAIEDGTVSGQQGKEAAGVIIGESKRLNRLVSDVLDLARLDAKRFTVHLEELDVRTVLQRLQQAFAQKASESGVAVEIEAADMTVKADSDRLIQVLSNLVENGMRYTPTDGRIRVSATPEGSRCRFDVVDGGPGLDPADFRRAFDRQYLWGKYRGVRDVGTGLGLAITKELVEAMGGEVSSTNDAQGGARFSVLLPLA
ncbi:MAG TPA: HAMP domain-containing sensor histidine kinase, partial [Actinomycetota bacterium]|nr:HAMP domain-containing sensor histidine kinase [Actinomycetota bacterium]